MANKFNKPALSSTINNAQTTGQGDFTQIPLQQGGQMGNQQGGFDGYKMGGHGRQGDFAQQPNFDGQPLGQIDNGFVAFSIMPTAADDVIFGSPKADKVNALAGNDSIDGGESNDSLNGGAGNDTINGGSGKDVMSGGSGKDIFSFSLDDSTADKTGRDVIKDFKSGVDKIDLSDLLNAPDETVEVIDTTSTDTTATSTTTPETTVNDAVERIAIDYLGSAQFSAADATGQARLEKGVLYVSTNADAEAELSIQLTGVTSLTNADFIA